MKRVASLSSTKSSSEISERLSALRPNDAALWGRMTAPQMVRHLGCACEVASGERAVAPIKSLSPAMMKWVALRSGLRWPKNFKTTPELARAIADDPILADQTSFEADVQAVTTRLERLASGTRHAATHPFFGPMTAADWMRWAYLHTDHHLRQFGR